MNWISWIFPLVSSYSWEFSWQLYSCMSSFGTQSWYVLSLPSSFCNLIFLFCNLHFVFLMTACPPLAQNPNNFFFQFRPFFYWENTIWNKVSLWFWHKGFWTVAASAETGGSTWLNTKVHIFSRKGKISQVSISAESESHEQAMMRSGFKS